MRHGSNLSRRGAMYYARMAVPTDLIGRIRNDRGEPMRELRRSLQTRDPREARSRQPDVLREWHQLFAEERAAVAAKAVPRTFTVTIEGPTPETERRILRDVYDRLLDLDDRERKSQPTSDQTLAAIKDITDRAGLAGSAPTLVTSILAGNGPAFTTTLRALLEQLPEGSGEDLLSRMTDVYIGENAKDIGAAMNAAVLNDLRDLLARGDSSCVADMATHVLTEAGYALPREGSEFKAFAHKLHRTMVEVGRRRSERDSGDFTGKPADDVLAEVAMPVAIEHHATERMTRAERSLDQWFDMYARENRNGVKEHSLAQARQSVRWLAEFVGHRPASEIGKANIAEWIDALRDFPTRAAQIREYKGLSFQAIIEASKGHDRSSLAVKTIRRMVSEVSGLFSWMENRGYIDRNPASGQTPRLDRGRQPARRPFKGPEIRNLLNSPLFTGNAGGTPCRPCAA